MSKQGNSHDAQRLPMASSICVTSLPTMPALFLALSSNAGHKVFPYKDEYARWHLLTLISGQLHHFLRPRNLNEPNSGYSSLEAAMRAVAAINDLGGSPIAYLVQSIDELE